MFNPYASSLTENTTKTLETPPLVNKMFAIGLNDNVHYAASILGTFMGILIICIWLIHTYKAFKSGVSRPKVKELIPAVLLLILLSGNMNTLIFATKNTVKNLNVPLHKVVAEDSAQSPVKQVTCSEPKQSQLSTPNSQKDSYINPRIQRAITQYKIDF